MTLVLTPVYFFFGFVISDSKGAAYGKEQGYPSAFVWKTRYSDRCDNRIGNLPGFCSDFHGNHFRDREGHLGSAGAGREYHGQAYREWTDADRREQRARRLQCAAASGGCV